MARRLTLPLAVALAAAGFCMWSQMTGFAWTDYGDEAAGPLAALVGGHVHTFLATAPAYGGSLLMRAPFALAPSLWGGGELAVYRMMAVPCLAAAMVLGLVLFELRARLRPTARGSLLVVLLAAGNPVTLRCLDVGHPEDLLGAALCAGAVLAALWRRPWLAAVLLGCALANKAWAIVAIGPVLLALREHRWAALGLAGAIAAVFTVPFALGGSLSAAHGAPAVTATNSIFQPWQIWWPLGDLGHVVRGIDHQVKVGYRTPPGWLAPLAHPAIALSWLPLSGLWWRRRGTGPHRDLLLLLALVLLVRCVFDPWNIGYYHLPFLLALLAWEALEHDRPPVLSLLAAGLVWASFEALPRVLAPDGQCAFYLAWAVPALLALAWRAYRLPVPRSARDEHALTA